MYLKYAELIEKQNITTYKVAKETGLGQSMFSDWKRGRCQPKVNKLQILANYFGVSIEYFLEEEDEAKKEGYKG